MQDSDEKGLPMSTIDTPAVDLDALEARVSRAVDLKWSVAWGVNPSTVLTLIERLRKAEREPAAPCQATAGGGSRVTFPHRRVKL